MQTGTGRSSPGYSLPIGLTMSVLVHVAVLATVRFDVVVDMDAADRTTGRRPVADTRMRVLDLRIAREPLDVRDENRAEPDEIPIVARPSGTVRQTESAPARVESIRREPVSRMPRFFDPRLWAVDDGARPPIDSIAVLRERVRDGIAGLRSPRGISPDAPQVGPLRYCGGSQSSPGCGLASAYPGRHREFEQQLRVFAEISVQHDRFEMDSLLMERARAMRSRAGAKRSGAGARRDTTPRN